MPDTPPVVASTTNVEVSPPPKSWHRLALSLFGISIIVGMWAWAVFHIYGLPPDKLASFTSITTNAFYAISVIIIFMITGRLVWEWSNASSSVTTVASEAKKLVEEKIERRVDPKDIPGADEVA
jgi:hypothetical protein